MLYVTEHTRYLDGRPIIKIFLGVEASVDTEPLPYKRNVPSKDYNPEEWKKLLNSPEGVMYRYRGEEYRLIETF